MSENQLPALSIILADDHAIIREGIKSILCNHYDLKVVGEAEDGSSALEMIRNFKADIVFLDLSMPRMRGLVVSPSNLDLTLTPPAFSAERSRCPGR